MGGLSVDMGWGGGINDDRLKIVDIAHSLGISSKVQFLLLLFASVFLTLTLSFIADTGLLGVVHVGLAPPTCIQPLQLRGPCGCGNPQWLSWVPYLQMSCIGLVEGSGWPAKAFTLTVCVCVMSAAQLECFF